MIFVLAKTSNPSSGELQDRKLDDGKTVYETMTDLCVKWGRDSICRDNDCNCGYSNVGIVVGATYPEQIGELRAKYPNTFFLIPGYGAQGGKAEDIAKAFDKNGLGAIINNSRGVLYAWKKTGSDGKDFAQLARAEVVRMMEEINKFRN
jgi:orotidine-5'-phosphate decarboxylase